MRSVMEDLFHTAGPSGKMDGINNNVPYLQL